MGHKVQAWGPAEPTQPVDMVQAMRDAKARLAAWKTKYAVTVTHMDPGGHCTQHRHIYSWWNANNEEAQEVVLRAVPDDAELRYLERMLTTS